VWWGAGRRPNQRHKEVRGQNYHHLPPLSPQDHGCNESGWRYYQPTNKSKDAIRIKFHLLKMVKSSKNPSLAAWAFATHIFTSNMEDG